MEVNHQFPVLTTGLSGLVGSRLATLLDQEFSFVDLSLDTGVDITDFERLKQVFARNRQIKTVIHLAAFTDVNAAWEERGDKKGSCFQINVIGTANIAQLCAENGQYLLHFSTDFVFDGKKPPSGGYTEKDKPNPIEWYGETKFLAEKEVEKYLTDYCLLRIAFPFKAKKGPASQDSTQKLDLVRRILLGLEEDSLPPMFSDQIITPTFIDDIAQVVKICLKKKIKGLYHCVGSSQLSPYQMSRQVATAFNFDPHKVRKITLKEFYRALHEESPRPRQQYLSLANQKLCQTIGFSMKTFPQALTAIKAQLQPRNFKK